MKVYFAPWVGFRCAGLATFILLTKQLLTQNFIPCFKAYFRKTKDPGIRCFIKKCPF